MKLKSRRWGAAALALIVCLAVAPTSSAKPSEGRFRLEPPERIVRIVKRIKDFLNRISSQEDFPQPPIPKP